MLAVFCVPNALSCHSGLRAGIQGLVHIIYV